MKQLIVALTACVGIAMASGVRADEKLARASGCMTCHQVDTKVIGPSFKEVAAKYKGDKGAESNLVKKVKAGGRGVWGSMMMPPNAHVKDEDIATIVKWILMLK